MKTSKEILQECLDELRDSNKEEAQQRAKELDLHISEKARTYADLMNDCYTNDYYGFIAGYSAAIKDLENEKYNN